jgi:hypothetical protein
LPDLGFFSKHWSEVLADRVVLLALEARSGIPNVPD